MTIVAKAYLHMKKKEKDRHVHFRAYIGIVPNQKST